MKTRKECFENIFCREGVLFEKKAGFGFGPPSLCGQALRQTGSQNL